MDTRNVTNSEYLRTVDVYNIAYEAEHVYRHPDGSRASGHVLKVPYDSIQN